MRVTTGKSPRKLVIVTIPSEETSAKALGFPVYLEQPPRAVKDTTLLRWGCGDSAETRSDVLNPGPAIALNVRKYSATKEMAKTVNTARVYVGNVPDKIEVIIRPFAHTGGAGYRPRKGPCEVEEGCYAVEAIKTKNEYRVWFCPTDTMMAKRVPLDDKQNKEWEEKYPCRSEWGYRFLDYVPKDLANDVRRAQKAIGLDFGAADVLELDGKWLFLELNSAPSIDCPRILRFYKRALYGYSS